MSRIRRLFGQVLRGIYVASAPSLTDGEIYPIRVTSSGELLASTSPAVAKSYVVSFDGLAAPNGIFFELPGVSGTTISIIDIYFYKPSVEVAFRARRLSSVGTGGTSTTPTPIRFKTSDGASAATPKLYTVAPTGGAAAVGNFVNIDPVTAGDSQGFTYGDLSSEPITIVNGESFALTVDAAATVYGYVRWTEA